MKPGKIIHLLTILGVLMLTSKCGKSLSSLQCIPGETWYENCNECYCRDDKNFYCKPGPCFNNQCHPGSMWFGEKYRCHCNTKNARPKTTCVEMTQQWDLRNKPCAPSSYLYDTCNLCFCDNKTNTTHCEVYENCTQTKGGICNKGEITYERCHRCLCTHTHFKVCEFDENCAKHALKPGECEKDNSLTDINSIMCFLLLRHECYFDYGCPGGKKCCNVNGCYMRCVDPIRRQFFRNVTKTNNGTV